jgi:hypothetical protein
MQSPSLFAIQYLENVPGVESVTPADARARLRAAFERLPISHVLLGWNLPAKIVSACREEASAADAKLFLWHPLLTGDGTFIPLPEWRPIGHQGEPVPGFQDIAEFTFVCPNQPPVRASVLDHLNEVITRCDFDGVFLDRIRFPSPAADPGRWLACFCGDCRRIAAGEGLDLGFVRDSLHRLLSAGRRLSSFSTALLTSHERGVTDPDIALLTAFIDFRSRSISSFVALAADQIRTAGLAVGLDCFSPALTQLVGQDLGALDACGEWMKVMTYGQTLGPAGLPFELLDLADWLVDRHGTPEHQAMEWLSQTTGLELPLRRADLRERGLSPIALGAEIERARAAGVETLLAGLELVEIAGVTHLDDEQIKADLRAFRAAGADGLVLSWDLWHIPLDRLKLVREVWMG